MVSLWTDCVKTLSKCSAEPINLVSYLWSENIRLLGILIKHTVHRIILVIRSLRPNIFLPIDQRVHVLLVMVPANSCR
jgi:hypothetical protein